MIKRHKKKKVVEYTLDIIKDFTDTQSIDDRCLLKESKKK